MISVLVPAYNMEKYLAKCVDTILEQTYKRFELILVDDGSTDYTGMLCNQYAALDSRIAVIHQKNKGLAQTRNVLLEAAAGEYITFIDSDDWVEHDYLEVMLQQIVDNNAKIAACNHWIVADGKKHKRFDCTLQADKLNVEQAFQNILYHGIPDVSAWGKLYERSLFDSIRYPSGKIYEDTYCIADIIQAAGGLVFSNKPLYNYLVRDDSISRATFNESKLDFMDAVDHLTQLIEAAYPKMHKGCIRRKVHAALSVRRYFVNCGTELYEKRNAIEKIVKNNAWTLLTDARAPYRDKMAVLALLGGSKVYDVFWETYSKNRKQF